MSNFQVSGWFADFELCNFYYGTLSIANGRIIGIQETGAERFSWSDRAKIHPVILPGLVDSHVHIESSMLMPSRFAWQAVQFGTVATVSDPHEIANVLGLDGVRLMMADADRACIKISFTAPSCVPATSLESAGAELSAEHLRELLEDDRVVALGEMMNYPGVLSGDREVMEKISLAATLGKPVDGHAPGLTGSSLDIYIWAGIHTDHECSTEFEARDKLTRGMKVLIREGSSARNFDQLFPVIDQFTDDVMLCTDDFHPDDLVNGHIDRLIRRGIDAGVNFFNLYRTASLNPIAHYHLPVGRLRPGDPADFLIAANLDPFHVIATYINGVAVFENGSVTATLPPVEILNSFDARPVYPADLEVRGTAGTYKVIRALDGELVTGSEVAYMTDNNGIVDCDAGRDILKIVVLNRYKPSKPAIAWISGFGMKTGALASSIAHDSHNIIAVGTNDRDIADAINLIISHKGGIALSEAGKSGILELPVAGLMSLDSAADVGLRYAELTAQVRKTGSPLKAPFMALSFMALLVIPHLKIGDRGLFNCDTFEFTELKAY